jgi:alcohol dehydrogenase class IV
MRVITLKQPKRIVFGAGCAAQCADDVAAAGLRRAFIVTSPPIAGLAEPLAAALKRIGTQATIYAEIAREPSVEDLEAALATARSAAPDVVIGLGGGSAMDVAKLVAALLDSTQDVRETFGTNLLAGRRTHLACLPTTSGTGSEVSPNAILLDRTDRLKKGIVSPYLIADAAYVDPLLTVTVPPPVTAATGLDALTHCIEAYANRFSHPIVDLFTLHGIRLIGASLLRAVEHGDDVDSRAQMSLGSLYGGLALGSVNTGAVHALAYPLGGEYHIAHGVSNAVLLPHVMAFNLPAAPQRYADIALALGAERGASPLETAHHGLERVRALSQQCGIPEGMSALGIPEAAIPHLAEAAMKVTRLLKNNLRELTTADAEAIFRSAY